MPETSPSPTTNPAFVPDRSTTARAWLDELEAHGIQVPPGVRAIVRDYERLAGLLDDVDNLLARSEVYSDGRPREVVVPMPAWERLCIARKAIGS